MATIKKIQGLPKNAIVAIVEAGKVQDFMREGWALHGMIEGQTFSIGSFGPLEPRERFVMVKGTKSVIAKLRDRVEAANKDADTAERKAEILHRQLHEVIATARTHMTAEDKQEFGKTLKTMKIEAE